MTTDSSSEASLQDHTPADRAPRPSPLVLLVGSGLFSGYSPFASGTVGSAVAVVLYWIIPGFSEWLPLAAASLLFLLAGFPIASAMERHYGKDPSEVVLDEVVGQWIALLLLPKIWYIAAASFFLFRFFDIIKPPPARQFDRMHGGFGIMMDDVAAGVYANLVLQALLFVTA